MEISETQSDTSRRKKRIPFIARGVLLILIVAGMIGLRFLVPTMADLVYGLVVGCVLICSCVLLFCIL
jgi:hypothetical protein